MNVYVHQSGYEIFFDKNHPLAQKDGLVYYHRHVASLKIGRWLKKNEEVHHIDGNKKNNNPENLQILTKSEHVRLENKIRGLIARQCECGKKISSKNKTGKCIDCFSKTKKLFTLSKDDLQILINQFPIVKIAKIFDVSDRAISKKCKKFGIKKQPHSSSVERPSDKG